LSFAYKKKLSFEDLQSMVRINQLFRRLASDRILFTKILKQQRSKIEHWLFRDGRPSRLLLAQRNVICSSHNRPTLLSQIKEGKYINGPFGVHTYLVGKQLAQNRQNSLLRHLFLTRKTLEQLCDLNVSKIKIGISSKLAAPIHRLEMQFKQQAVGRRLMRSKKPSPSQISPSLLRIRRSLEKEFLKLKINSDLAKIINAMRVNRIVL
jgi:hypothetical protein